MLRATPRPRSPAAGRTEAAECPFLAAVRDLLQGNRRCFCPGWERGAGVPEGEARAAKRPSLRQTPGPTPTPVGFLIAQDGGGRGGHRNPHP